MTVIVNFVSAHWGAVLAVIAIGLFSVRRAVTREVQVGDWTAQKLKRNLEFMRLLLQSGVDPASALESITPSSHLGWAEVADRRALLAATLEDPAFFALTRPDVLFVPERLRQALRAGCPAESPHYPVRPLSIALEAYLSDKERQGYACEAVRLLMEEGGASFGDAEWRMVFDCPGDEIHTRLFWVFRDFRQISRDSYFSFRPIVQHATMLAPRDARIEVLGLFRSWDDKEWLEGIDVNEQTDRRALTATAPGTLLEVVTLDHDFATGEWLLCRGAKNEGELRVPVAQLLREHMASTFVEDHLGETTGEPVPV